MGMDGALQQPRRDTVAFAAIAAFAMVMYAVPGEWIAGADALRLALVTSSIGLGLMLMRRVGRMEPIFLDGARGGSLIAVVLLSAASISWSTNPANSEYAAGELVKLAAIYFTIVNVVSNPKRLAIICGGMVLASIVTSIGVINWYETGIDLVEGFRARWVGVYSDPNHMAMNLGIIVPLAVAFLVRKESGWLMRVLCTAAAGLAVVAIVFSHSRGGFIGLSIAMSVWAFLEKQRRVQAIVAALVLAVGLVIFAPKSFWARNETVAEFHEDASAMGRVYAWNVASKISTDKPLLGVGIGSFRFAWPLYAPVEAKRAYVAHNIFLDVIGELGFTGLFFFLIFVGGASGGAFSASKTKELAWLSNALAASVTGYLLCNCFSGYILSAHQYVLYALAASAERIARMYATAPETAVAPAPASPQPTFVGA